MRYCPKCRLEFRDTETCPRCNGKLLQPAYASEEIKSKKNYLIPVVTTLIILLLLFLVKFDFNIQETYSIPVTFQSNTSSAVMEGLSYRELNHTVTEQSYVFFFENLDDVKGNLTVEFECLDENMQTIGRRKSSIEIPANETAEIEIRDTCSGLSHYRYITRAEKVNVISVMSTTEGSAEKKRTVTIKGNIFEYLYLRIFGI